MGDLEILIGVVAALYLHECAAWPPRGAVAWRRWLGRAFRPAHPSPTFGNRDGGLVLAPPLPPLGTLLMSEAWPLSITEEGAAGFTSQSWGGASMRPRARRGFTAFAAMRSIEARERAILVNGEAFAAVSTRALARHLAALLRELAAAPAAERVEALGRREGVVRALANAQLALVAVAAPMCWAWLGLAATWPYLLAAAVALLAATATAFFRAHRDLHPEERDERWRRTAQIALSPLTSIRACDFLAREAVALHHPLAVARAVAEPAALHALARRALLDARHPILPASPFGDEASAAAERAHRERFAAAIDRRLREWDAPPETFAAAPPPEDALQRAYCPRCDAQFVVADARCEECGGRALAAFA